MDAKALRGLARDLKTWKTDDPAHEMAFERSQWRLEAGSLELPDLALARSYHYFSLYDEHLPVEVVQRRPAAQWFAEREGCIVLGIALIAFVLGDLPALTVELPHEKSRLGRLYFCKSPTVAASPLLEYEPVRFTRYHYIPDHIEPGRFFCADAALAEAAAGAPLATHFTWSDPAQRHAQSAPPDGLLIAAPPARLADLGQLLIDFGRDENLVDEFAMESSLDGSGGIAHGSVELRLHLPGSLAFPQDTLAGLCLPPDESV